MASTTGTGAWQLPWRLLDCALKRDWKGAQATLEKHVHDCVTHMIDKRLVL
jgi:hypothetical protein